MFGLGAAAVVGGAYMQGLSYVVIIFLDHAVDDTIRAAHMKRDGFFDGLISGGRIDLESCWFSGWLMTRGRGSAALTLITGTGSGHQQGRGSKHWASRRHPVVERMNGDAMI